MTSLTIGVIHENSVTVACYSLCKLEISDLALNKFKILTLEVVGNVVT